VIKQKITDIENDYQDKIEKLEKEKTELEASLIQKIANYQVDQFFNSVPCIESQSFFNRETSTNWSLMLKQTNKNTIK
jgi:hypothetical protein